MTTPEQALQTARAAAAEMRARGHYAQAQSPPAAPDPGIDHARLAEWALIDPDLRDVRSTRRAGRPITVLKHGLLRLLAQYHGSLISEQTRFNVHLLAHVRRLEDRIEALERERDEPDQGA